MSLFLQLAYFAGPAIGIFLVVLEIGRFHLLLLHLLLILLIIAVAPTPAPPAADEHRCFQSGFRLGPGRQNLHNIIAQPKANKMAAKDKNLRFCIRLLNPVVWILSLLYLNYCRPKRDKGARPISPASHSALLIGAGLRVGNISYRSWCSMKGQE